MTDRNDNFTEELAAAYPELDAVREAATDPVYLVGGAVRDLLLERGRSANLDLVVEGDAGALAGRLGAEVLEHERFATATVRLDGLEVDVAAARTETYAHPGRASRGQPGARRSRRTWPAATSRSTRWRCRSTGQPPDRPLRRPGGPRREDAAGPARGLLRRRPDSRLARRPLRGAPRLRARARNRGAAPPGPTSARSRPTAERPSCCGSLPNRAPREASSCSRPGGWSSPVWGRRRRDRPRGARLGAARRSALGRASRRARPTRAAGGARAGRRRGGDSLPRSRARPSEGGRARLGPGPRSTSPWRGRWARSGWTVSCSSGAGSSSRSTART